MKVLFNYWWLATTDIDNDVAAIAQKSFELAIPIKKRVSVLLYLSPIILKHVIKNLSESVDTLSDMVSCKYLFIYLYTYLITFLTYI